MKTIEFSLERRIAAPIDAVFARLADIDGHNDWMPRRGTILRHTQQTSAGEVAVGTTYVDDTSLGTTPGEVVELAAPTTLTYHWWDRTERGRTKAEGWPAYTLRPDGDGQTVVRLDARLDLHGASQLLAPVFRRVAVRERTTTIDALRDSFA